MYKCSHCLKQESGFSLVELLTVIVIINILACLAFVYLTSSRRAANGASAVQSMRLFTEVQHSYSSGVGNRDYANPQELFNEEYIDAGLARACIPTPTGF